MLFRIHGCTVMPNGFWLHIMMINDPLGLYVGLYMSSALKIHNTHGNFECIILMLMDIAFHTTHIFSLRIAPKHFSYTAIVLQIFLNGYFRDDIQISYYKYLSDLYHTPDLITTMTVWLVSLWCHLPLWKVDKGSLLISKHMSWLSMVSFTKGVTWFVKFQSTRNRIDDGHISQENAIHIHHPQKV